MGDSRHLNDSQDEELLASIEEAHAALQIALQQFNSATSSEVVDDAIYLLMAAELRYEGLLRVARRRNLHVELEHASHPNPFPQIVRYIRGEVSE